MPRRRMGKCPNASLNKCIRPTTSTRDILRKYHVRILYFQGLVILYVRVILYICKCYHRLRYKRNLRSSVMTDGLTFSGIISFCLIFITVLEIQQSLAFKSLIRNFNPLHTVYARYVVPIRFVISIAYTFVYKSLFF